MKWPEHVTGSWRWLIFGLVSLGTAWFFFTNDRLILVERDAQYVILEVDYPVLFAAVPIVAIGLALIFFTLAVRRFLRK